MSDVILDASALIALLRNEPGAGKIADVITTARMSAVNYAEVISHFVRAGMPEREIDAMLAPLPIDVVPLDKSLARLTGRLRAVTADAGLSLGDRSCLALASRDSLPAWTADRAWRAVAEAAKVTVVIIR